MVEKDLAIFEFQLKGGLSLKLSEQPYPRNLEISDLQKGLILAINGVEVIEEGGGFGSPLLKYKDKTFFSKTAKIKIDQKNGKSAKVCKTFLMDTISLKKFREKYLINDKIYHPIHRVFTRYYLTLKPFRTFFDSLINTRKKLGIENYYIKTNPRGIINIIYHIREDIIDIIVDISKVNRENLEEIVILNEQGAKYFPIYSDSNGIVLSKDKIGAWDVVKSDSATLMGNSNNVSYTQENITGASLIRGWEKIENRLSWSGLNYILKPKNDTFMYSIKIRNSNP